MKLDFLVNSLVAGGAERVLILLANYFDQKGHDVRIITFNEPEVFSANENVKRVRLHHGKIKNHMVRSTKNLLNFYSKNNNRPDILLPFMTETNLIGIIIGRLYKIKVVAAEHNNHLKKIPWIGNFTRNYGYKFADALTVLTSFDEDFYKAKKVNVSIMPNPCTFPIYREEKRKRENIIIAVGDLNRFHHKGFDNMIPIVAPVLKKNPEWKLHLVGSGDEGFKLLSKLVEEHDIINQVIFEGYSNKVAELMREAEIYLMTSRFEGLPMVILEAMSQGMACISFNCKTGPSDIITDQVDGLIVEDQNFEQMTKQLEILVQDRELRLRLSKNAINALDRYKIETIYQNYLGIFKTISN